MTSLILGSCGGSIVAGVNNGTYRALVPTAEQFEVDVADNIPGGFAPLRDNGIDEIELLIDDDQVTFRLDGGTPITREVRERHRVRDNEGSGPFKGTKEVLVLGAGPRCLVACRRELPAPTGRRQPHRNLRGRR